MVVATLWWWWLLLGCGGGCDGCSFNLVAIFGLFGDAACHVIDVGTYRLNLRNQGWASSSAVKRVLYCDRES